MEVAEALPAVKERSQRAAVDRSRGWATDAGAAAFDSPASSLRLGDVWVSDERAHDRAENDLLTAVSGLVPAPLPLGSVPREDADAGFSFGSAWS